MNIGRAISLCAWAAIIAAWAQGGTVQKSSNFASVPDNGLSHSSAVMASTMPSQTIDAQRAAEGQTRVANPADPWKNAELVDHLGEELGPPDYWALAQPGLQGLWPPPGFAHPYRGPVLLLRGQGQEAMQRICGKHPGMILLGCAEKPSGNGVPRVALADRATILQNGWTENLNEIHEAGHLNGSRGHDGWRDLARGGAPAAASPRPVETPAKPMPEGRPKAIVVAQVDAVGTAEPHVPPEAQYVDEPPPPPQRRPPPRYYRPPPGLPPGWIFIPAEQRAMPCLPTLLTFGALRFCI
jgi:hypothetical protein